MSSLHIKLTTAHTQNSVQIIIIITTCMLPARLQQLLVDRMVQLRRSGLFDWKDVMYSGRQQGLPSSLEVVCCSVCQSLQHDLVSIRHRFQLFANPLHDCSNILLLSCSGGGGGGGGRRSSSSHCCCRHPTRHSWVVVDDNMVLRGRGAAGGSIQTGASFLTQGHSLVCNGTKQMAADL